MLRIIIYFILFILTSQKFLRKTEENGLSFCFALNSEKSNKDNEIKIFCSGDKCFGIINSENTRNSFSNITVLCNQKTCKIIKNVNNLPERDECNTKEKCTEIILTCYKGNCIGGPMPYNNENHNNNNKESNNNECNCNCNCSNNESINNESDNNESDNNESDNNESNNNESNNDESHNNESNNNESNNNESNNDESNNNESNNNESDNNESNNDESHNNESNNNESDNNESNNDESNNNESNNNESNNDESNNDESNNNNQNNNDTKIIICNDTYCDIDKNNIIFCENNKCSFVRDEEEEDNSDDSKWYRKKKYIIIFVITLFSITLFIIIDCILICKCRVCNKCGLLNLIAIIFCIIFFSPIFFIFILLFICCENNGDTNNSRSDFEKNKIIQEENLEIEGKISERNSFNTNSNIPLETNISIEIEKEPDKPIKEKKSVIRKTHTEFCDIERIEDEFYLVNREEIKLSFILCQRLKIISKNIIIYTFNIAQVNLFKERFKNELSFVKIVLLNVYCSNFEYADYIIISYIDSEISEESKNKYYNFKSNLISRNFYTEKFIKRILGTYTRKKLYIICNDEYLKKQKNLIQAPIIVSQEYNVCFIIDNTKSMGSWINVIKDICNNLFKEIKQKFNKYEFYFGCVLYADHISINTDKNYKINFTQDENEFKSKLEEFEVQNGDDVAEDWVSGFKLLLMN